MHSTRPCCCFFFSHCFSCRPGWMAHEPQPQRESGGKKNKPMSSNWSRQHERRKKSERAAVRGLHYKWMWIRSSRFIHPPRRASGGRECNAILPATRDSLPLRALCPGRACDRVTKGSGTMGHSSRAGTGRGGGAAGYLPARITCHPCASWGACGCQVALGLILTTHSDLELLL